MSLKKFLVRFWNCISAWNW